MQASSLRRWALAPVLVIATAVALALALLATPAAGEAHVTYTVTIENLTAGPPFTPPVAVTNSGHFDICETGPSASAETQAIAENGNNDPLVALIGGSSAVFDSAVGTAAVLPGETATLSVTAPAGSLISTAMMLICTNDGFAGLDSVTLASGSQTIDLNSYDAGTETNTADFPDILPPCQRLIAVASDDDGPVPPHPAPPHAPRLPAPPALPTGGHPASENARQILTAAGRPARVSGGRVGAREGPCRNPAPLRVSPTGRSNRRWCRGRGGVPRHPAGRTHPGAEVAAAAPP